MASHEVHLSTSWHESVRRLFRSSRNSSSSSHKFDKGVVEYYCSSRGLAQKSIMGRKKSKHAFHICNKGSQPVPKYCHFSLRFPDAEGRLFSAVSNHGDVWSARYHSGKWLMRKTKQFSCYFFLERFKQQMITFCNLIGLEFPVPL